MPQFKVDEETFTTAVESCTSIRQVIHKLGYAESGGAYVSIARRIKSLGLDISHFVGQGHAKGRQSPNRSSCTDLLVILPDGSPRLKASRLRAALTEAGVEYKCTKCGISKWLGEPIVLDVDHIDGNRLDNRQSNLRLLCPNCHRQTKTWGRTSSTCESGGMADTHR